MDSGSLLNVVSEKCEAICNGEVNLGYLSASMDINDKFAETTSEKENTTSLVRVTPDMDGEGRDRDPHFAFDSPLTLGRKLRERSCLDYATDRNRTGGCRFHTPKVEIFDPSSAAGLDDLLMTTKKHSDERRTSVSRSLNFGGPCTKLHETKVRQGNDAVLSDEEMVESVYENLLDMIFSYNMEDTVNVEFDDDDGCKTPTSGPRLTGTAETCPGAPMKNAVKARKINRGSSLCRKLEF